MLENVARETEGEETASRYQRALKAAEQLAAQHSTSPDAAGTRLYNASRGGEIHQRFRP